MWWDEMRKRRRTVVVQLECPYTRSLVCAAFARRVAEWRVVLAEPDGEVCEVDCDLHWGEYECIDWAAVLGGKRRTCCYCIRKGLIRKAQFAYNMKKWIAKRLLGRLAGGIPETYIVEVSDPEYFDEALYDIPEVRDSQAGIDFWIAKPSVMNQATAVVVFDHVQSFRAAVENSPEIREWVIQRYIHPPLLIHDRKFHIRCYVLCVGQLHVYVWKEMLALFARETYDSGLEQLAHRTAHLTNTCLHSDGSDADASVHLLSEIPRLMDGDKKQNVEQVSAEIHQMVGECFEAVSCELSFLPLPNAFEFFGFDFMVDASWHCWLLEANAEPDFRQTGDRLKAMLQCMFEEAFQLLIDPLHPFNPKPWENPISTATNNWTPVFHKAPSN